MRPSSRLSHFELIDHSQGSTPFYNTPTPSPSRTDSLTHKTEPDLSKPHTTTTEAPVMSSEPITPFQGDGENENPEDFIRSFFRKMGAVSDEVKRQQFPNFLQADGTADTWYAELSETEKKDWISIEIAFRQRWPRKVAVKKTQEEYEEELMASKLRMEDLGKKEKIAGRDVYSHVAWADKTAAIVRGAKLEASTMYIGGVRRGLPNLLREKIGSGHKNWTEFLKAVQDIDISYIRDGVEIWKETQANQAAVDERIKQLEKLTLAASTAAATPQQRSNPFSITAPMMARSTSLPLASQNPNTFATARSIPANPLQRAPNPNVNYNQRPPPTQPDRDAIRIQLQRYPHHPDTEAGRLAHQAQQAEWARTHGIGARVTESTPYPLRPGTAPINSGECFTCGFTGHLGRRNGSTCGGQRPLHPHEQAWRAICSRILREPRQPAANINWLAVDDYGTVWSAENQGNGEGSLA